MSKLPDISKLVIHTDKHNEGEVIACNATERCTYAVTSSKKPSAPIDDEAPLCSGQKSFISLHSTDRLCHVADIENPANLEQCNVEVLSLNEVFRSTSEDSLSDEDEKPAKRQPSVYSYFDIPKNTMYVIGSNPSEPNMPYQNPPKKITKTGKGKRPAPESARVVVTFHKTHGSCPYYEPPEPKKPRP